MRSAGAIAGAGLTLGGLVPFSAGDYPGRLSAVLFTQGCPLRCRYCHNPHLREPLPTQVLRWDAVMAWLRRRQGLLDAVVVSGGEPTAQSGLASALEEIRSLGFATGLHSSGVNPRRLASVLPLLDWVGLDVKAPFRSYASITGSATSGQHAQDSLAIVTASDKAFEIRTTLHARMLGAEDILEIAMNLQSSGVRQWVLQRFRATGCADSELGYGAHPSWLDDLMPSLKLLVPNISIR